MGKQPIPTTGLSPASPMAFWAAEHSLSPRSPHGIADPIVLESEKQDLERSSFWRPPMAHHVGEIEHSDVTRCHDVLRERFRVFRHSQRIPVLEMSACDPVNRPDGTLNAIPGRQSASHTILGPQISFRLEKQNTKSDTVKPPDTAKPPFRPNSFLSFLASCLYSFSPVVGSKNQHRTGRTHPLVWEIAGPTTRCSVPSPECSVALVP